MTNILQALLHDETGFIVSAELVVISTLLVVGLVTGLQAIQASAVGEMKDIATSVRALNQSYSYTAMRGCCARGAERTAWTGTSRFMDCEDNEQQVKLNHVSHADFYAAGRFECAPCVAAEPCHTGWYSGCQTSCQAGCVRDAVIEPCYSGCNSHRACHPCADTCCSGCAQPMPCGCELIPVLPPPPPCPVVAPACSTCTTDGCGLPGSELARSLTPPQPCSPCAPTSRYVIW
ncbi:MAG: hypothetical protein AB7U20_22440 [Planctomycetaceae bacterium]